jgi:hypothetical protein
MYDNPQLYSHPTDALRAKLQEWALTPLSEGTKYCVVFDAGMGAQSIFILSGEHAGIYLWISRTTPSVED